MFSFLSISIAFRFKVHCNYGCESSINSLDGVITKLKFIVFINHRKLNNENGGFRMTLISSR